VSLRLRHCFLIITIIIPVSVVKEELLRKKVVKGELLRSAEGQSVEGLSSEAGASEAGASEAPAPEEDADVYTPCPPRRNPQYNCSPAFVTCDGEYSQAVAVDMCYNCDRCGRTITHSIDNPTVCKRCF
jgi:hypothetical protein